jgi:hypothetical protein
MLSLKQREGCLAYNEEMKQLDDQTLEAIAELICGGGPDYSAPGPYRTASEIHRFFQRVGIKEQSQSSTRKWFTLEILQACNNDATGKFVPGRIERVLLRLANPIEYQGQQETTNEVIEHLNRILLPEGFRVILQGVTPSLEQCSAGLQPSVPKTKPTLLSPPDFTKLANDQSLDIILHSRWNEAQLCAQHGAYLSSVVMMGSILEATLLSIVSKYPEVANRSPSSPKDPKTGKPKQFGDWGLSSLIDVAHECGWLQGDVKRYSHALRESRNLVHPWYQRMLNEHPDEDTCNICWQVVSAAMNDLMQMTSEKQVQGK